MSMIERYFGPVVGVFTAVLLLWLCPAVLALVILAYVCWRGLGILYGIEE